MSQDEDFKNRVILVVDDEERMARFIRLNLEHDGFRVVEAHRGFGSHPPAAGRDAGCGDFGCDDAGSGWF